MRASALPLLALLAIPGLARAAGPAAKVECPAGTHFVEGRGCVAKIVGEMACPAGTRAEGTRCVAIVDTSCPDGMRFAEGVGCIATEPEKKLSPREIARQKKIAEKERRRAEKEREKERRRAEKERKRAEQEKKNGTFSSGTSDRLTADCQGVRVEVSAGSTFSGGRVMLLVEDRKVDEGRVDVGETVTLRGAHQNKPVELVVQQGMFGTRYKLQVAGEACRLRE